MSWGRGGALICAPSEAPGALRAPSPMESWQNQHPDFTGGLCAQGHVCPDSPLPWPLGKQGDFLAAGASRPGQVGRCLGPLCEGLAPGVFCLGGLPPPAPCSPWRQPSGGCSWLHRGAGGAVGGPRGQGASEEFHDHKVEAGSPSRERRTSEGHTGAPRARRFISGRGRRARDLRWPPDSPAPSLPPRQGSPQTMFSYNDTGCTSLSQWRVNRLSREGDGGHTAKMDGQPAVAPLGHGCGWEGLGVCAPAPATGVSAVRLPENMDMGPTTEANEGPATARPPFLFGVLSERTPQS